MDIWKKSKQKKSRRRKGRRVRSSSAAKMQNIREHTKTTKGKGKQVTKPKMIEGTDRCKTGFNRAKLANP